MHDILSCTYVGYLPGDHIVLLYDTIRLIGYYLLIWPGRVIERLPIANIQPYKDR